MIHGHIAQSEEATRSKWVQCQFESDYGYQLKDLIMDDDFKWGLIIIAGIFTIGIVAIGISEYEKGQCRISAIQNHASDFVMAQCDK